MKKLLLNYGKKGIQKLSGKTHAFDKVELVT